MTEHLPTGDWLYDALPEVYRVRDAAQGHPLRALLAVLGEQGDVLQDEAARLYDNQFIETCEEWLTPYLGALVGYRPMHDVGPVSQRALVGRWIELMRSKGTAATLEDVARGAAGWPASVAEHFQNLSHNQFMNHIRPGVHGAIDTRDAARLEALGGAFDSAHYSVDAGRIARREGRMNIHNIGIYLWRLAPDMRPRRRAFQVGPRRFSVHPLGLDTQVFNMPETEAGADARAAPIHLPIALTRRFLHDNLADFHPRAFRIWIDGAEAPTGAISICNLSDDGAGWAHAPGAAIGFDPVLGRIATPTAQPAPGSVEVRIFMGVPDAAGGGAYERLAGFAAGLAPVTSVAVGDDLQAALDIAQPGGAVEVTDSETYDGAFSIDVAVDARIELRAANGQHPTLALTGDLTVTGAAQSEVTLNGFLAGGAAIVVPAAGGNALRRLTLRHMTLLPGIAAAPDGTPLQPQAPSLIIEAPNVIVEVEDTILGGVRCHPSTVFIAKDSAIDATEPSNIALSGLDGASPAGLATLRETTVIGKIDVHAFTLVSNAILMAALAPGDPWTMAVQARDTQTGCARFSYIPPGARVPRRHRCQPSLAMAEALRAAEDANPMLSPLQRAAITRRATARLRPGFFAERRHGRAAYLQLLTSAPLEIRAGADDESEMGFRHRVHQPQRESNLRTRLEEFLPSGLEAGFFFET